MNAIRFALLPALLGLALAGGVRWLAAPAPVPDRAAPFVATQPLLFAGQGTLVQRLRPGRDGLRAVDLIVVAESAGLPGEIEARLSEWPSGREIRLSRLPAAAAPAGLPWSFRPGQPDERWLTFGFEPVPDAAGRELQLTLSYPQGRDVPGERLAVLVHLPSSYPGGELRINGAVHSGNLLFRLAGSGTRGRALAQAGDNLARQQPYWAASLALPATLAALSFAVAVALAGTIVARGGEQ